jgi:serine/threonine protein kinase
MPDQRDPSLPDRIGEYTPTEKIGEGGFGVVYAATAPDGTAVAIKVLRPELSNNAEVRERLRREAIASQAITSDRVARVLDHDTEIERPYIVMELVQGSTLTEHVAQHGPLAGAMLTSVAVAMAEALRDIQASGVLHRDLKPSNVMLGPDGIKILDFGIAAISEAADFTQTGAVLGSASWMSPEQITGVIVEASSDVFAMGLVLAFAALGHHPYGEGRPEALMYRMVQGQPDLEGISGPSRRLIEAMLRSEPQARPTVDAVIEVLSGSSSNSDLLSPDPLAASSSAPPLPDATRIIPSAPPSPRPDVNRPKRGKLFAAAALVLLLAGAAIAAATLQSTSTSDDVSTAAEEVQIAPTATQAAPPTTEEVQIAPTATQAAPPTTEKRVEVARTTTTTTTLPAVPVYKIREQNGNTFRWNRCQNPISIYLNNSDSSLSDDTVAAVARFLTAQAAELSTITDHVIIYRGLSEDRLSNNYVGGERILIQISGGGDGILDSESTYAGNSNFSWDRTSGSTREIDSVGIHLRSTFVEPRVNLDNDGSVGFELADKSKRLIMYYLGLSFGLDDLVESDFIGFGVTDTTQMFAERMNWESIRLYGYSTIRPEWGPGDKLGMYISQLGNCF